jgi:hypothetical protein
LAVPQAAQAWPSAANMSIGRFCHTATLLPNGKVLVVVAGGNGSAGALFSAVLFDPGLGFNEAWRPVISTCSSPVTTGGQLLLSSQGSSVTGFRGISGGSGGSTNDSPTDYPLVQVRRLDNEWQFWVPGSWVPGSSLSDVFFTSQAFQDIQTGYYLVTVYASGIPSAPNITSFTLLTNTGPPTAVELASFTATGNNKRVVLEWDTRTEKDNAGFYLWRADTEQGDYTRITQDLIPAEGTATQGTSYSFADYAVVRGQTYYYKLEDMDRNGASTFHGPVSATVGHVGKGVGHKKR